MCGRSEGRRAGRHSPSKRTSRTEGRRGRGAHAGAPSVGSSGHRVPAAHGVIPTAPASKTRRALPPGCCRQIVRGGDEQTEQRGWSWRGLACPPPRWRRRAHALCTAGSRLWGSCCSVLSPPPCCFTLMEHRANQTSSAPSWPGRWAAVQCLLPQGQQALTLQRTGGPGAPRPWWLHSMSPAAAGQTAVPSLARTWAPMPAL